MKRTFHITEEMWLKLKVIQRTVYNEKGKMPPLENILGQCVGIVYDQVVSKMEEDKTNE